MMEVMTRSEFHQEADIQDPIAFVAGVMSTMGIERFEIGDFLGSPYARDLYDAACRYVKSYGGDFEFLIQIKRKMSHHGGPTDAQAKGILNCIAAEVRKQKRGVTPVPAPAAAVVAPASSANAIIGDFSKIPDGTVTIVDEESGTHRTLRISIWKAKGDGSRIAAMMTGPDNDRNFTGFATIRPDGSASVWNRFSSAEYWGWMGAMERLATATADEFGEYREAWAMRSGRCARCGRKLTVPASLHRGLGPECVKHEGGMING